MDMPMDYHVRVQCWNTIRDICQSWQHCQAKLHTGTWPIAPSVPLKWYNEKATAITL